MRMNQLPDAVLLADAEQEEFVDLEIITLNAYLKELAYDHAYHVAIDPDMSKVEAHANELLEYGIITAKEFVEVQKKKIRVAIDVEIVDDRAMDEAVLRLMELDEFTIGKRLEFGEAKKFHESQFNSTRRS